MLRIARREDVPQMLAIYAPYVLRSTATFEYDVPSLEEFYRRFDTFTRQYPWLLWEEDEKIEGYAYASPPYSRPAYAWCVEPTIYLRPECRGKGVGEKLYTALEAILREQGYQVIYALVCEENQASIRFHEKMGYEKELSSRTAVINFSAGWGSIGWKNDFLQQNSPMNSLFPDCQLCKTQNLKVIF